MKIAIAGYGIEGQANYRYWRDKYPDAEITIADERKIAEIPEGAKTICGETALQQLTGFDLVIRTAGLAPYKIQTDGKIWSATNEFFAQCPAPIIGITGSKGKGTTASLVDAILKASHLTSWLVGNIGVPALDVLSQINATDIVVYELSSFQLWDLEKSPHTAVVTMIEPDHLDVHTGFTDYINAKAHISLHHDGSQSAFYLPGNAWSEWIAEAGYRRYVEQHGSSEIPLHVWAAPYKSKSAVHVRDDGFYNGEHRLCAVSALQLPGDHNVDNACAAISAVLEFEGVAADTIESGLRSFKGLPHRLQFVKEVRGVKYYDDSIATTPTSATAALQAFHAPKVIILGGSYKGADFQELARQLKHHDVHALIIGDEAPRIVAALQSVNFEQFEIILEPTMEKVVRHAAAVAQPGSVVLLSPAAASFGLFKNYSDRGDQFVAAVQAL